MKVTPFGCLVFVLALAPVTLAQSTDDAPAPAAAPKPEDAQVKALREQLEREGAARKAELDATVAADIARNPDGANAVAARKAADDAKAAELAKQAPEEKPKAEPLTEAQAAAAKVEQDRKDKDAAASAAASAAEQKRTEAARKAAVDKWRASARHAPSIMMGQRADGSFTVMVDGTISSFATAEEAKAFAEKTRRDADTTLSY